YQCVVGRLIPGIRKRRSDSTPFSRQHRSAHTQILAPRIGTLKAQPASGPQCGLQLQRMVVRVSAIGPKVRLVELWIGLDEVLRESVVSKDRALNGARNKRQALIPRKCGVVVE